ncbi:MAG TPA: hypothetical protein VG056_04845 [Pirellulales bacterium]|nr:hypothetical protein [Pirellulales bacterium]
MGTIPNGDQGFVDANGHLNGNGHSAALPIGGGIVREADDPLHHHHHQNGKSGHSMLETTINRRHSILNGTDFMVGTGVLDQVLPSDTIEVESPAIEDDIESDLNGAAGVFVGEPSRPAAQAVESAIESESSFATEPGRSEPAALPEHPSCGSLFTPYFVTEIRELRNRSRRRRSWWRRIFG